MTLDERARRELHERLESAIGLPAADTLMESLPPMAWTEVATKADIAVLDRRFDLVDRQFEALGQRFEGSLQAGLAGVRVEMATTTRTLVFALIAAATSFGALVLAAARFA
jgi:hypothetical protein